MGLDRQRLVLRTSICGRIRERGFLRFGLESLGQYWARTANRTKDMYFSSYNISRSFRLAALRLTLKACPHPAVASNKPSISGCQSINQFESGVSVYQHSLVATKSFSSAKRGKTLLSSCLRIWTWRFGMNPSTAPGVRMVRGAEMPDDWADPSLVDLGSGGLDVLT